MNDGKLMLLQNNRDKKFKSKQNQRYRNLKEEWRANKKGEHDYDFSFLKITPWCLQQFKFGIFVCKKGHTRADLGSNWNNQQADIHSEAHQSLE